MQVYKYPEKKEWKAILMRPLQDTKKIFPQVQKILDDIKKSGDVALLDYTLQFDNVSILKLEVGKEEIEGAVNKVSSELKEAINIAVSNIEKFHLSQKITGLKIEIQPGVTCWQKSVAIQKVGLYIPGGTAPLFSTVLMLAIPAKIAGCREIILCTPPTPTKEINPAILYAAKITGVTRIFKLGGVQAIGAMAYGTETIPNVYKIFGPGNQYVTAAKQIVSQGDVAIDMPAGPSEVAVMADESANPAFIASDLLSQAEHGVDSQVILVTDSEKLADKIQGEIKIQLELLSRKELASKALEHSRIILVKDKEQMIEIINEYAPEHLIISTQHAEVDAEKIINAGSVFIGPYSPESAGDYVSGTNHTLPTYGHAKAYNGVNLDDFVRKITFQQITKEGLQSIGPIIETMAEAEQLTAHKNTVRIRLKSES